MKKYILQRLLLLPLMLLGISVISFTLLKLAPGDYLDSLKLARDVSPELIERQKQQLGLDRSAPEQFLRWLASAVRLDFGYSFTYKIPVVELIAQRLPATFLLALCATLFAWMIAIPLGILAAIWQGSFFDRLSSALAFFALAVPEFFLALLAVFFASQTGWLPLSGLTSIDHEFMAPWEKVWDVTRHLFLPTLVLGIGSIASLMRIMRSNFLETMRAEFVTAARAKGLSEGRVLLGHTLRNAINPLVTIFGYSIAGLLSGSLIVEIVMGYPGIGLLVYEAFFQKDIYVVMASILMASIMLVLGNLVGDIALALSDPRIRLDK